MWVPQIAVLRDLCGATHEQTQVCEYADLWHPNHVTLKPIRTPYASNFQRSASTPSITTINAPRTITSIPTGASDARSNFTNLASRTILRPAPLPSNRATPPVG